MRLNTILVVVFITSFAFVVFTMWQVQDKMEKVLPKLKEASLSCIDGNPVNKQ